MTTTKLFSITIVSLLIGILVSYGMCQRHYEIDRDIDAVLLRAQVAATAEDMSMYLKLTMDGMDKHDIKCGNLALVFQTPGADVMMIRKSLSGMIERLEFAIKMSKSSQEYIATIDDIRGTIREFRGKSFAEAKLWHDFWYLYFVLIIAWTMFIVFGVWCSVKRFE